ncbi:hypothetical protein AVEN_210513-1 [Araneus ventricosus]|uniref:Uncharacterized protein n=1 Tax=Araneus ventricosus TaxID=182803 RepID=A0A4Y2FEQ7_ARAVE|nr:hypothetical protein AVEN_210513-1 [Araneus ventricosus]
MFHVPDADKSPRGSTQEQATPFLTKASEGHLNDSRHDINTGTEDGVLMAIIGLGQTPLAGGTSRHRSGCISTSHHYSTLHGSKIPFTSPAFSRTCYAAFPSNGQEE